MDFDFRVDCVDPDCATGVVLNLYGALTIAQTGKVRAAVTKIVDKRPGVPLVVDLNGVTSIDIAGITALLNAQRLAAGRDGALTVRVSDPSILRSITESGLRDRLVLDLSVPMTEPSATDVMGLDPPSVTR